MIGRPRSRELERLRLAETRTGCPLELLLPFTMCAQDRVINRREERWSGELAMWLAVDPQHLWILHGRHRPTGATRPADPLGASQRTGHRERVGQARAAWTDVAQPRPPRVSRP